MPAGEIPRTQVRQGQMKPIAAHHHRRIVTSTIRVLIITPVTFSIMKLRALRRGYAAVVTDDTT